MLPVTAVLLVGREGRGQVQVQVQAPAKGLPCIGRARIKDQAPSPQGPGGQEGPVYAGFPTTTIVLLHTMIEAVMAPVSSSSGSGSMEGIHRKGGVEVGRRPSMPLVVGMAGAPRLRIRALRGTKGGWAGGMEVGAGEDVGKGAVGMGVVKVAEEGGPGDAE